MAVDTPVAEDVVLGGRYQLGPLLGSGGMAQVYDGWDHRLDRAVAVKLLRPELAAQADLRQRFQLEARAAARLTHPNVVAVYDAGDDRGRSFIVMERLRGESLADVIARGPVDQAWLRRLAGEVLSALGAAHEAGIIHRDIKPANILLGPDGRAKVADFGIARVTEDQSATGFSAGGAVVTGTGLVLGTPAYLAPERAMGDPTTPQSDLYSLGVVLYEALTGQKPFAGVTSAAIATAALQGAAQNPYLLRPDADPNLVAVIGRAMAPNPAARYISAEGMAGALRRDLPAPTAIMPAASAAGEDAASHGGSPPPGVLPPGVVPPGSPPPGVAPPGSGAAPRRRRGWPGRVMGAMVTAAFVAIVVGLVIGGLNPSSQASGPPGTTATTVPAAPATAPTTAPTIDPTPDTTAPTTPAVVASQSDPIAAALQAWASHLSNSSSAAAGELAEGLDNVAAADPSTRAAAASSLLSQTVRWYQQGELSTQEYVAAATLLHLAGAPSPPPVRLHRGSSVGGEGG